MLHIETIQVAFDMAAKWVSLLLSTASKTITRPGKRLQFANLKMAIEIVSFPIKDGDFP